MRGTANIVNADKVQLEVALFGTVEEFRELRHQLNTDQWPSSDLTRILSTLLSRTIDRVEHGSAD